MSSSSWGRFAIGHRLINLDFFLKKKEGPLVPLRNAVDNLGTLVGLKTGLRTGTRIQILNQKKKKEGQHQRL